MIHLDLATMQEHEMFDGWRPAQGSSDDPQAWLGTSASVPNVVVGTLFSDGPQVLTIEDENGEPVQLAQLAWDAGGRFVYGLTSDGRVVSVDSTGELAEVYAAPANGYRYVAVATGTSQDGVAVLRLSDRNAPLELGELTDWTSGSPTYRPIAEAPSLSADDFAHEMTLTPAAGLAATPTQEEVVWGPSDAPGWIVSNGVQAFLVDDRGGTQQLPWEIHRGADVNEDRDLG
jgi:hypothetical protein